MDTFSLIFGGVLVFWMQAGFWMIEKGTVHKKNTKNILIENMFDASIAALYWWFIREPCGATSLRRGPREPGGRNQRPRAGQIKVEKSRVCGGEGVYQKQQPGASLSGPRSLGRRMAVLLATRRFFNEGNESYA